jgi:membrane protein implicated in regulation of membrane protease activity
MKIIGAIAALCELMGFAIAILKIVGLTSMSWWVAIVLVVSPSFAMLSGALLYLMKTILEALKERRRKERN